MDWLRRTGGQATAGRRGASAHDRPHRARDRRAQPRPRAHRPRRDPHARRPVAQRIRRLIEEYTDREIALGTLDITFHRDDVHVRAGDAPLHPQPVVRATRLDFPLEGMTCVLCDDVLFTGRTIRAAIDALFDYGRPARVQLAVLVDRGHRELPIRPDYVGKNLPTSHDERVQVQLVEVDEVDRVLLVPAPESEEADGRRPTTAPLGAPATQAAGAAAHDLDRRSRA